MKKFENIHRFLFQNPDINIQFELLKLPRFRRLLNMSIHPVRLLEHFRYGFGMRSLVRDLIVRPDVPQDQ